MIVDIWCKKNGGRIPFEQCVDCAKCLPSKMIESLKKYEHEPKRNVYYVKEVIGCLKQAYYKRKQPSSKAFTLNSLYSMKRGQLLGAITDKSYSEFTGELSFNIDGEPVKLTARLDCYDPEKGEIIEVKTLENIFHRRLPRDQDVLQLQCYGTIFKDIFQKINRLYLAYLDMNQFIQFEIPIVNNYPWLQNRVKILHTAIRASIPPDEEIGYYCKYCLHRDKCNIQLPTIITNK